MTLDDDAINFRWKETGFNADVYIKKVILDGRVCYLTVYVGDTAQLECTNPLG